MIKKILLISSVIVCVFLILEAYRENLSMEWIHHQTEYKNYLKSVAKTQQDQELANKFEVKMRQIVLPDLNRVDRCVICHVGIENPQAKGLPQPLAAHPGDLLEVHEVEKFGCTICHDGQGRAIMFEDALAHGHDQYWQKPVLLEPFLEANCYRCHQNILKETPNYNRGKDLFMTKGCLGCHKLNGKGGAKGTDISDIANAPYQSNAPSPENRTRLLKEFHGNINLAFLYESVRDPKAQPKDSAMLDYKFNDEEALALTVFLKSLSEEEIPKSLLYQDKIDIPRTPLERGKRLFGVYCAGCHGAEGVGGTRNPNAQTGEEIPTLRYVAEGFTEKELIDKISHGVSTIEKLDPAGPEPPLEMPTWKNTLTDQEINDVIQYLLSLMPEEEIEEW